MRAASAHPVAVERVQQALARHFGPSRLLVDESDTAAYRRDASEAIGERPAAVVLAESGRDIELALSVAAEARVPVVPRGGGTGKTGGAVPSQGGIVIDLRGFGRIREIDRREHVAIVEPGVLLSHFRAAVAGEGLFYAPDPASGRVACTLGGNVATNAGGPRALKYGVTGRHVLGIEAFLIGGQRMFAGRRTAKGVTGYDVASLLVGSEGTLAVFGELTLRLLPPPECVLAMLVPFERMAHAAGAVMDIIEQGIGPSCLELLDLRIAGGGILVELVGPQLGSVVSDKEALLLMEVDGSERECEARAGRLRAACRARGSYDDRVASRAEERERLWDVRSNMSATLRRTARHKLSEDIAVPRRRLGELIDRLAALSERREVRSVAYGHAGDGNLHVNFLWDDPAEEARVQVAVRELFELTVALGGTLSGEHGVGVLKAPYLPLEQSPELIALQRSLKRSFDPEGLLNPGKIFPAAGGAAP
ncbi:MAG TPA: FAD-linked oxidase C-terminal domain-containing protein [Polyangiaceae bacterium]|nr:FAD-linked oxidase C-terminal domain-containing protein [Polyangiaceae bacterium]